MNVSRGVNTGEESVEEFVDEKSLSDLLKMPPSPPSLLWVVIWLQES